MESAYMPMPSVHPTPGKIGSLPHNRPLTRHEKLVQQTRKWVATSFFEPMLKQMRQSPFHSDLFDGGEAGKAFESMYDERLSEKMASDATDTLVSSIVRKIEGSKAYAKHSLLSTVQTAVNSEREGADRVRAMSANGVSNVSTHY
jgi:Rod binding domain-containing protein